MCFVTICSVTVYFDVTLLECLFVALKKQMYVYVKTYKYIKAGRLGWSEKIPPLRIFNESPTFFKYFVEVRF